MNPINIDDVIKKDAEKKREKTKRRDEVKVATLKEYVELVQKDPKVAQNAPARALEIIRGPDQESANVKEIPEEERWFGVDIEYPFFSDELFGIPRTQARVVEYIEAGANHASTGKQVLLIVGPPGTGKSTLVRLLKKGFENYDVRPVYTISDCPKFEEPLHALPRHLREEVEAELGVKVEGDLCPICREKLKELTEEDGVVRWWDLPVEPMTFSIQGVRGLTSFEPSDEKSSDVTALTGRENISVTSVHGFNHPRAYEISGKIPKAERGLCEGRELTSSDTEVLRVFFSVAEERELEIQGSSFPHLSVDTIVVGHTNITPYKKFASNKEYEGLHQRFFVVHCPYPLRIKDELAVYKKLIERDSDFVHFKKCHIAPGALELAATFAILTRLIDSQKDVGLLTKAKIYNGEKSLTELEDSDTRPREIGELLEEGQASDDMSQREGMFGVSSRDVLAALNAEIVRQMSRKKCLTPLSVVRALRNTLREGHRMGYTPEDIERFLVLLSAGEEESVMTEYKDYVLTTVSKAFLKEYRDLAEELFNRYVEEARYYRDQKRKFLRHDVPDVKRDPVSNKPRDPDVKFMRSVEKHLNLDNEDQAEVFRGELLEFLGNEAVYDSYPPLARAVEKKLLEDSKETLTLVLSTDKPHGTEEQKRLSSLFGTMKDDHGFCKTCSRETVEQAREFLSE